jgi:hypothetical protein
VTIEDTMDVNVPICATSLSEIHDISGDFVIDMSFCREALTKNFKNFTLNSYVLEILRKTPRN